MCAGLLHSSIYRYFVAKTGKKPAKSRQKNDFSKKNQKSTCIGNTHVLHYECG
jgi:hypothetical protein